MIEFLVTFGPKLKESLKQQQQQKLEENDDIAGSFSMIEPSFDNVLASVESFRQGMYDVNCGYI